MRQTCTKTYAGLKRQTEHFAILRRAHSSRFSRSSVDSLSSPSLNRARRSNTSNPSYAMAKCSAAATAAAVVAALAIAFAMGFSEEAGACPHDPEACFFSADYYSARARFREAASGANATLHRLHARAGPHD